MQTPEIISIVSLIIIVIFSSTVTLISIISVVFSSIVSLTTKSIIAFSSIVSFSISKLDVLSVSASAITKPVIKLFEELSKLLAEGQHKFTETAVTVQDIAAIALNNMPPKYICSFIEKQI